MANSLFDAGRGHFLDADIDWSVDTIKLIFVDHADDVPLPASDDALDDILVAARVATSGAFAGKTSTGGVADANDVTVTSVTGDQFESIVIYKDSGVESTSWLAAFIDTATGLPCTPNGGDSQRVHMEGDSHVNPAKFGERCEANPEPSREKSRACVETRWQALVRDEGIVHSVRNLN